MTTSPDPALVDTNVLVYALYQGAPNHAASRALLGRAQSAGAGLCVAAQNLAEFYAVVTDSRRVTPARSPQDAATAIDAILALPGMTLLSAPPDLVSRWTQLARQHGVTRRHVFDVQLVAIMLGNAVSKIYTYNVADFQPFHQIQVLVP